jgi:hypothetical protein
LQEAYQKRKGKGNLHNIGRASPNVAVKQKEKKIWLYDLRESHKMLTCGSKERRKRENKKQNKTEQKQV